FRREVLLLLPVRQVETEHRLALVDKDLLHSDADAPTIAVRHADARAQHEARAALRSTRGAQTSPAEARRHERSKRHVTGLEHERDRHASTERKSSDAVARARAVIRIRPTEITTNAHREEVGILPITHCPGTEVRLGVEPQHQIALAIGAAAGTPEPKAAAERNAADGHRHGRAEGIEAGAVVGEVAVLPGDRIALGYSAEHCAGDDRRHRADRRR